MMSAGFRSLLDSFQARSADWVFTLSAYEWRTSPASIYYDVVCVRLTSSVCASLSYYLS